MLTSGLNKPTFLSKKIEVFGIRNYADRFFVDFMKDQEPTSCKLAPIPAYFCGRQLRIAIYTEPLWDVQFFTVSLNYPPVAAAILKFTAHVTLLQSYVWRLRPFW